LRNGGVAVKNQENEIQNSQAENELNISGNAEILDKQLASVEENEASAPVGQTGSSEQVSEAEKATKDAENAENVPCDIAQEEAEKEDNEPVYGGEESIVDLLLGKDTAPQEPQKSDEESIDEVFILDDGEEFEEMSLIPLAENEENEDLKQIEESEPEEKTEREQYDPEKPRKIDSRFDFVELFVFTLALVMIISSFFFRHSVVTGASMESTLFEGEHIIISNLFYTPKRGDIIVCTDYTTAIKKPIVKRIIALGGDTVKITYSGETPHGEVYVNGVLLEEDYVYIDMPNYHYLPIKEFTVPEGELFVLGDHRNVSTDSRIFETISEDSVLGKVLLRFYPFEKFGIVE